VWGTQWPPVSLATAAALLERDGHGLRVVDCPAVGMDRIGLGSVIRGLGPHFVFWSTGTPTLDSDLGLSSLVKENAPRSITGVFGTHVTALPEAALGRPSIDMVIRGEPEETILEICRGQKEDWGEIRGLSFRDPRTDTVCHTPARPFLLPEAIPPPAWHYLDLSPYRLPLRGTPFLIVAPIRGCPYACSFCTAPLYYGKRLRKRPIDQVVDEMMGNMERFQVRDFFIWADTFTADQGYVRAFCREIMARRLRVSWTCNSRVDTVDRETLALMKAAGLWMISFGLESGNPGVLEQTGKGITVEQSRRAVSMTHDLEIKTSGHFILGLPGETAASMRETLALALDLPLDVAQFYAAAPFPGTRLYDLALQKGWIRKNDPYAQDHAGMDLPGLPGPRVEAFRRYAYQRFYGRPLAFLRLLRLTRPGATFRILRQMPRFLGWARGI
jgi:anaerobic magnesium-protoporphyrin IX monomethyl ester cyclase